MRVTRHVYLTVLRDESHFTAIRRILEGFYLRILGNLNKPPPAIDKFKFAFGRKFSPLASVEFCVRLPKTKKRERERERMSSNLANLSVFILHGNYFRWGKHRKGGGEE